MKTFKESIRMFKYNLPSIILFELIYKLVSLSVIIPIIYSILNLSVKEAGIKFLSAATVNRYFRAPSTYVFFLVILVIFSIYIMMNISGLIYIMEYSRREEKANLFLVLFRSLFNAFRAINPKNIGMFFFSLLVVPFTYTVVISGTLVGLKLPDFVRTFVKRNDVELAIALIVYLVVCFFTAFRIYALNYYTLYRLSFKDSIKASKVNVKRHAAKTVFGIIAFNLILAVLMFFLEGAVTTVFAGVFKNFMNLKQLSFFINTVIQIAFVILYIIFSLVATPLIYSFICANFYEIEGEHGHITVSEKHRKRREKRIEHGKNHKKYIKSGEISDNAQKGITVFFVVLSVLLNGTYIYLSVTNRVDLKILYSTRASVTAHRGDSKHAPENTMAAFRLAVENQADIIELDVRQTKDGRYVVMHDESLHRTTGVNKDVGMLTYEEIEQIDAGIKFSEEYKGEHIPTLEEVLEFAIEEDVYLNIELKPADTDQNYVEGFVDILHEYDFVDQCVVACSDYKTLCAVKELDADIQTVYIMGIALGEIADMENVDIFSIKYTYISANMVNNIHQQGKEIYAWTVNNQEAIKRLLLLDVDSIITDTPYETKDFIFNANDSILSDFLQRLVEDY